MAPPVHRGLLPGSAHYWPSTGHQMLAVPGQLAVQPLAVPTAGSAAFKGASQPQLMAKVAELDELV